MPLEERTPCQYKGQIKSSAAENHGHSFGKSVNPYDAMIEIMYKSADRMKRQSSDVSNVLHHVGMCQIPLAIQSKDMSAQRKCGTDPGHPVGQKDFEDVIEVMASAP